MNTLWELGPSTVREVHEALREKQTGYTTVLKQMQVMVDKGLLTRSERYRSHVYEPLMSKEQIQRALAERLVERAFNGSAKNLVLGVLSLKRVSPKELTEIRQMLGSFEKGS